jgi:lipoic acid synthetase
MNARRHPEWLKVKIPSGPNYAELRRLMRDLNLHTVCEEARCPNIGECWEHRAATFLLLGDVCTRACGFCAVQTGRPTELDWAEPQRVAKAVEHLGLKFVVMTSVNRDDLKDGGAAIFAETIRQIRRRVPDCGIEVLIPDFKGDGDALQLVVEAKPDVLNHNVETVPRCYSWVRPQAKYERSVELLGRVKELDATMTTKSGLMVGVGEEWGELLQTFRDLSAVGCDLLTIGQYLRPTLQHIPIVRYYEPDEFRTLKEAAENVGFRHVESGPLVRSSYHAWDQVEKSQVSRESIIPIDALTCQSHIPLSF